MTRKDFYFQSEYFVEVPTIEFTAAIRTFKHVAQTPHHYRAAQFTIGPTEDGVELIGPGAAYAMPGEGHWPGRATFGPMPVLAYLRSPPTSQKISIRTNMAKIWIAGFSVNSIWQPGGSSTSPESLNNQDKPYDLLDALQRDENDDSIGLIEHGFTQDLFAARDMKRSRILSALKHLAEFGVTFADVEALVDDALRRRTANHD